MCVITRAYLLKTFQPKPSNIAENPIVSRLCADSKQVDYPQLFHPLSALKDEWVGHGNE